MMFCNESPKCLEMLAEVCAFLVRVAEGSRSLVVQIDAKVLQASSFLKNKAGFYICDKKTS